ncbi:family 16 glycoside hydrolase [Planctomycetota bacterium]
MSIQTNRKHQNLVALIIILLTGVCFAADKVITPDLTKIATGDGWTVFNREVKVVRDGNEVQVQFDGRPGAGVAWLDTVDFTNGVIECDIKGKGQRPSFVGIVFHGLDNEHFDAVYFRAFNFRNEARKDKSVQYISHPENTWHSLRKNTPGKYESAIDPAPDPDKFFHVKLVIEKPKVRVYINHAQEPTLVVDELSDRTGGKIGLYVDNTSDGAFANLKITPQTEAPLTNKSGK